MNKMRFKKVKSINSLIISALIIFTYVGCSSDDDGESQPNTPSDTSTSYKPLLAYDMSEGALGETFPNWKNSVYDETHFVSNGKSVKISTSPGDVLPACSGSHGFAGKTNLAEDMQVTPGHTLWYRVMLYIPESFSFGHKYSVGDDDDEAKACNQNADGNLWIKWMVLSPTEGTARVYLMPSGQRRAVEDRQQVRIISEALHQPGDFAVSFPKNQWFALQVAVKVSSGSDGFIRAWIDDTYLGEVTGRTLVEGASIKSWGIGDYWNGIPWTDGEAGRTDFWMDEVILASDMEGYGAPTGEDSGGRSYIDPKTRVADL